MNYLIIYNFIIDRAKNRNILNTYYEKHHIIPKCMNGSNEEHNIVKLTAKEHFVCHHLLMKAYKNTVFYKKLLFAFYVMHVGHYGKRYNASSYEKLKMLYSLNHPMKSKDVSSKVSIGLIEYYNNETAEMKIERIARIKESLNAYYKNISDEEYDRICNRNRKILSSDEVKTKISRSLRHYYLNETDDAKKIRLLHHHNVVCSNESNEKRSKTQKNNLAKLTKNEMIIRMKNSFGSCDHIKRGKSISESKKGKRTNQQQIMGERYALLTDEEFESFLKTKSERVHKRITNLRNLYKGDYGRTRN